MDKTKMERLIAWADNRRRELRKINKEHIESAKDVLADMGIGYKGTKNEELLTYYYNIIDSKEENIFSFVVDLRNMNIIKMANFLCDTDKLVDKFINEYNNDELDINILREIQADKINAGIGQDLNVKEINSLISNEEYDALKEKLEAFMQEPISINEIELFIAGDVNMELFLTSHKENYNKAFFNCMREGLNELIRVGRNIRLYDNFRSEMKKPKYKRKLQLIECI